MVEAALVLPIFFMVVLGIMEFGRAFWFCQVLQNASREACRKAVTGAYTTAQVTTDMKTELSAAGLKTTSDATISILVTVATGNPAVANNEVANATTGDLVAVSVSVPFNKVAIVPGKYLTAINLKGLSSMRHE